MSDQDTELWRTQHKLNKEYAAQVTALQFIVVAMTQEIELIHPGFKHACLEKVSAVFAELPAATGEAGLETQQMMMAVAEGLLQR